MKQFKPGQAIRLLDINDKAEVVDVLGRGGQGIVYRVRLHSKEYAMKWYYKPQKNEFYDNLRKNIAQGAPSDSFLWPLFLTEKENDGTFGYIMDLRGLEYEDFGLFLLAKAKFESDSAMVEAAINICCNFRVLHNKGFSYQDLNDGNFFINPKNGDVLICDNDNVAPSGVNSGIMGKCRYMAPEIVRGEKLPDAQSDRFSLSVILFLLFFGNHPLEGKRIAETPCMTEKHERKFYGKEPLFIYDPSDDSNRPVKGIHNNVIAFWNQYPKYVRETFEKQFSQEVLKEPQKRQTEKEWLKILSKMRNDMVACPTCGEEQFTIDGSFTCPKCKHQFNAPVLVVGKNNIVVCANKKVYEPTIDSCSDNYKNVVGEFVESKTRKGLFALRNKSSRGWVLTKKDGSKLLINNGDPAPLLVGNKIEFGNSVEAEVKQIK